MAISGNQLRAARALAGIGQRELAESSNVSINTIRNMEARGPERVRVRLDTMERIIGALGDSGVEFTGEDDGRAGVRLVVPDAAHVARRAARGRRGP
jgi:transcriptional regulator with XRE-family HTH domain